jgi:hypothetical protein
MRFQPLPVSKQLQRFRALSKKVSGMLDDGSFFRLSKAEQLDWRSRLVKGYRALAHAFSTKRLRRTLATAAVLLGLAVMPAKAQDFAAPVEAPFGLDQSSVDLLFFADMDNDGDLDALISRYEDMDNDRIFAYQENTGTATMPQFGMVVDDAFGIETDSTITNATAVDMDNDGDLDVILGTYSFEEDADAPILYFENTGTPEAPAFAAAQENPFGLMPSDELSVPLFLDLDNDGDFDMITTVYNDPYGDKLLYQENTGTAEAPAFGTPQENPFGLANDDFYRIVPTAGDLDLDGDIDLLFGGDELDEEDTEFRYYENTGTPESPAFAVGVADPFNLMMPDDAYIALPTLVDIDADGDLDIIATITDYDEEERAVYFFENLANPSSVTTLESVAGLQLFPTATDSDLNWSFEAEEGNEELFLQVFSRDGQSIIRQSLNTAMGTNGGQLDVSALPAGMYLFSLSDNSGNLPVTRRFFVR